MNVEKTGALIRETRKERGLTQKALAQQLGITDRAVSKWERGLCVPDIAQLEPLGEALGLSVLELLRGQRAESDQAEAQGAGEALRFAEGELRRKLRAVRKRWALSLTAWLMIALAVGGLLLWQSGVLVRLDRVPSPDGRYTQNVYSKELRGTGFSLRDGLSVKRTGPEGGETNILYGDWRYRGSWWSPDSQKLVMEMESPQGTRLVLDWMERNSESNLNAYLDMGVSASELALCGRTPEDLGTMSIDYHFLQWAEDSAAMLIRYGFADQTGEEHEGYFWYNCETGTVQAILELREEGPTGQEEKVGS